MTEGKLPTANDFARMQEFALGMAANLDDAPKSHDCRFAEFVLLNFAKNLTTLHCMFEPDHWLQWRVNRNKGT